MPGRAAVGGIFIANNPIALRVTIDEPQLDRLGP